MFQWSKMVLSESKAGNTDSEYEDAWDIYPESKTFGKVLRVAVADGATMSSYSGRWACALTSYFVSHKFLTTRGLRDCTEKTAITWWKQISNLSLPWYAEEKARKGAFSSLLGLQISLSKDPAQNLDDLKGEWRALAVGDSNLFHVRNDQLLRSFPIETVEEFGSTPILLSSNLDRNKNVWTDVKFFDGQWQPGDLFILATDALAAWLLTEAKTDRQPWDELISLSKEKPQGEGFDVWLGKKRASKNMRNDDVTCLILKVTDKK